MSSDKRKLILAILLFLIGLFVFVVGTIFKIQHWPYGSELQVIGSLIQSFGLIFIVWRLIRRYKSK